MHSLREIQSAFGKWLLGRVGTGALTLVAPDGWLVEERLEIYRNNVFASLTKALAATFPVVCRLVDERFFGYAAHEFVCAHPPRQGCLAEYGADFPGFLAAFTPCRDLAYLPDVARFEWLMNAAAYAADAPALSPAAMAAISPEDTPRMVIELHPSMGLLSSPWPIDRLWLANRQDDSSDETICFDSGGACVEVRRAGDAVVFQSLDAANFAFRDILSHGAPLEAATEAAFAQNGSFDLTGALAALFHEGAVTGIRIASAAGDGR